MIILGFIFCYFQPAEQPETSHSDLPQRHFDDRGFFQELFNEDRYPDFAKGPKQISMSHSSRGVVRGLHRSPYFKLVTVLSGKIIDILVDLDPQSPTFKQWRSVELSAAKPSQVFIPPRFGHGFIALEDNTVVCYAQGGTFVAKNEMDVNIFDPSLGISLPEFNHFKLILSPKDKSSPLLVDALAKWQEAHRT